MGDEVKRLRPGQQTVQEINVEAEAINLNTDEIEEQQVDGTQQARITDGVTVMGVAAATQGAQVDLVGLGGADVDAGAGDKSAQTQRVTLADDDLNAALLASVVATFGSAAVAYGPQLALLGKDLLPVVVAEGQAVRLLADLHGQPYIKGYSRATGSLDASIVAQTKIPPIIEPDWAALAAANDETPHRDVRSMKNHTVSWDITIGTLTSMDLRIWCTLDEAGALPLLLADFNVLAAGVLEDLMSFENLQIVDIWGELQGENGAADGSVVFAYAGGN